MPSETELQFSEQALHSARVAEYDAFAPIYNQWMAEDFCRRSFPALQNLLLNSLPPQARILDLCCGSGQIARALTELSFQVTGIDASEEMLTFARQNAPGADFFSADARNFSLPEPFEAAISTFNSLAHIRTIDEMVAVFRNIRRALLPGASFLFDLSMEEAYTSKWRGSFALVSDARVCVIQPSYNAPTQTGTNQITVFDIDEEALNCHPRYHRSDFTITQKCHSEADLLDALNAAQFKHVQTFDAQRDLAIAGESGRSFFLCR